MIYKVCKPIIYVLLIVFNLDLSANEFEIKIQRNMTCSGNETIGRLLINNIEMGRTLELPWENNQKNISRIPSGSYDASIRNDGNLRWRIELKNVPNRENIQLHLGNYARQIRGCILVGETVDTGQGACMVTKSVATLSKISNKMSEFSARLGGNQSVPIDIKVVVVD